MTETSALLQLFAGDAISSAADGFKDKAMQTG
jgi:hypothetical protein